MMVNTYPWWTYDIMLDRLTLECIGSKKKLTAR